MNWEQYKPEKFEYIGGWIRNWFSNFGYCGIEIDGIVYGSVENFYQSRKTTNPEIWELMSKISPAHAKKMGREIALRPDWEQVKYEVMKTGLRAKFNKEPHKSQLLETGDQMIIEWNNWGDKIWGVDVRTCKGQNLLGKALMEIRDELKSI